MLKMIRHLDYVVLLCRDVKIMKVFYHGLMGFPIYRDQGEWVELRVGSVLLALRPRGRDYDGLGAPAGSASVQLAFRVAPDEVEVCHQELIKKGVKILEPPTDQDYGHKTLFFQDPEGNILEIYADVPGKQ